MCVRVMSVQIRYIPLLGEIMHGGILKHTVYIYTDYQGVARVLLEWIRYKQERCIAAVEKNSL